MKTYEDGLNEAWELARNITCTSTNGGKSEKWVNDVFGYQSRSAVMRDFSAKTALEMVYEREMTIKVGDEVKEHNGRLGVVIESPYYGGYTNEVMVLWGNGCPVVYKKQDLEKTGRHFSEIEDVLKQMQKD